MFSFVIQSSKWISITKGNGVKPFCFETTNARAYNTSHQTTPESFNKGNYVSALDMSVVVDVINWVDG